ncbi:MAG: hypothetical protein EOT04_03445 [Candidatus Chaera renei]|uniref:LexA repressor DNA-binding domain-containing protein n=1 Tax=Candidatus Chaera renei TaxID=2506947 RepID=A0A4Q0AFP0_9BACT|nr:MAG: hypothetical protein EOT04_03445 [Candidatus Chaera renei]
MADANSRKRPSKKQHALLSYLDEFIRAHGYGPSYREIMRALDYKSVSTVAVHVDNLIAKGWLKKRQRSARSLEVVGASAAAASPALGGGPVGKNHAAWLAGRVKQAFEDYERSPDKTKQDNLYVLVGALQILGLDDAAAAFKARLSSFKTD